MATRRRLTPGDLAWIEPGGSLYPSMASAKDTADGDVQYVDDWDLCLIVAWYGGGWATILYRDQLWITPGNNLMSSDETPSSVSAR